jgi:molybdate transport system substrate-binding protein
MPIVRRAAVLALAGGLVVGCSGATDDASTLRVFAAASLTDAFTELGEAFEQDRPDLDVELAFASSSDLARQVVEGAPADVYASADTANMDKVTESGAATGTPVAFATNRAEIIVAPGNPLAISGLEDLADRDLVVVLCAPEVPCGAYAEEVFARAGVSVTPDSFEENVRGVVTKVTLGEADAGIVYRTDVLTADDAASGVEIPAAVNVVAEYPIATVSSADAADEFVDFVTSAAGRDVLESYGFGAP